jgi:hypothetical protein
MDTGHRVLAAGLLVVAGADLDALDRWLAKVGVGRRCRCIRPESGREMMDAWIG